MFDYGAGNLHSLEKALVLAGGDVRADTDPIGCLDTDVLVLPGVGSFPHAAARLAPGLDAMREALRGGLPAIGICLGMQLLFDGSDEGAGAGLALIAGHVERLRGRRVPQIGWNGVDDAIDPLFASAPMTWAYYANSFVARPRSPVCVTAWSTHEGERFPAVVRIGSVLGVQFHPEKSSAPGVRFLAAALAGGAP